MINDKDIKKLKEVFVTKEEFEGFMEVVATKTELRGMEKRLGGMLDKIDKKLDEDFNLKHRLEYIENTLNIQPAKTKL